VTCVAAGVSNNPDAVFISRKSIHEGKRIRWVTGNSRPDQIVEIEGAPDWVLEIVRDSSVRKDNEQLRDAYHKAEISEYWLVDARRSELSFQILRWRKTGYAAAPSRAGWQRSRVFGRWFRLSRKRDDLGLWEYTLRMRAK